MFLCFVCFFILCHRGWKMKSFLFPDNDFGTLVHFSLANHAWVSHLLHGQPHLLECYYRNCLIGTHMCSESEWSVFLNFSVNCSKVAMFQIMPALCLHRQGESGGQVNQMWTGLDRERGTKNPQTCAEILYGWTLAWH